MLDLEDQVRATLDRMGSSVPIPVDFDQIVRARIATRRRRSRVLVAAAIVLTLVVAGAVVPRLGDGGDESLIVTDDGTTPRVPNVVGVDYLEAQARVQSLEARVLLSLDRTAAVAEGLVTRTQPAAGLPIEAGTDLVIFVAWNAPSSGPATTLPVLKGAPPPPNPVGAPVASNTSSPPVGLTPGLISATSDPRCEQAGNGAGTVRFLRDEVVGCFIGRFVWLDRIDDARTPIGTMPDLRGVTVKDATARLTALGVAGVSVASSGELSDSSTVTATEPDRGAVITKLARMTLIVGDPSSAPPGPSTTVGPAGNALPTSIGGTLANGLPFIVYEKGGLCVRLGDVEVGCVDGSGPSRAIHFFSGNVDGYWLWSGYLPSNAQTVFLVLPDGRHWDSGLVIEPTRRFWAIPIPRDYNAYSGPMAVVYRDASGTESRAPM